MRSEGNIGTVSGEKLIVQDEDGDDCGCVRVATFDGNIISIRTSSDEEENGETVYLFAEEAMELARMILEARHKSVEIWEREMGEDA